MSIFIKTGYWEKAYKGLKGWLNLDTLIKDIIATYSGTSLTSDEVDAIQASDSPSAINPLVTESELQSEFDDLQINDLADVIITSPLTRQILRRSTSNEYWENVDPDWSVIRESYRYDAQSYTADTVGDWRTYADANGYYVQYCTVGNATKGAGTWVTKFTVQI
jgi:hypothetical protein